MIKVITTVGTSLFTNFAEAFPADAIVKPMTTGKKGQLANALYSDWENAGVNSNINAVKGNKSLNKWISDNLNTSCAEISSLLKIAESENDHLDVYLLATHTVLSRLAAEIIKDKLTVVETITVYFNPALDVIYDLQIQDALRFNKGLVNLINRVYKISGDYFENIIFNVTGGYKGVIPYITLMCQINKAKLCYIFEESNVLLTIPQLPITFNDSIFNNYKSEFILLDKNDTLEKDELSFQFLRDCNSCLEVEANLVCLNPIGRLLWFRYKSEFYIYYASDDIQDNISTQTNIIRILKSKFHDDTQRKNKTENKNDHIVYDDGRNVYRIFYKEEDGKVFIYKTFEDHVQYEFYLKNTQPPRTFKDFKPQIIQKSK